MFCSHKYGKIEKGYQYCSKCGKAIPVKCNHCYEQTEKYKASNLWGHNSIIIVSRCKYCGEYKNMRIEA